MRFATHPGTGKYPVSRLRRGIFVLLPWQKMMDSKTNFPALTGLRAVAAWMVFLHHYNPLQKFFPQSHLCQFVGAFHVGVGLFFVLSGFLITHRYAFEANLSLKNYFLRRWARIFPVYFILLLFSYLAHPELFDSALSVFLNLTILKGFFSQYVFSGIAQSWSLTVEETFYLVAPLLFWLISRSSWSLIILPILFFILGFGWLGVSGQSNWEASRFFLIYSFPGRIVEFCTGIGLAILIRSNWKSNFPFFTYFSLPVIIFILWWMAGLPSEIIRPLNSYPALIINHVVIPIVGFGPLLFGLIHEKTTPKRILESSIFQILGKSSYAFYLIHIGVIADWVFGFRHVHLLLPPVLLCLISVALWKWVEEPIRKFILNRWPAEA